MGEDSTKQEGVASAATTTTTAVTASNASTPDDEAARRIQSIHRGRSTRKQEARKVEAARRIQSIHRGRSARKQVSSRMTPYVSSRITNNVEVVSFSHFQSSIRDGVVWLDYASIPQIGGREAALARDDSFWDDQEKAVQSIPAYVASATNFWVVAPPCEHKETQQLCNLASWHKRGTDGRLRSRAQPHTFFVRDTRTHTHTHTHTHSHTLPAHTVSVRVRCVSLFTPHTPTLTARTFSLGVVTMSLHPPQAGVASRIG